MHVLLTGVAGFIGFHCARRLLNEGHIVTGVDNLNDYYDVKLKEARLAQLSPLPGFQFIKRDIMQAGIEEILPASITHVLHLAAQAGVRYSLQNPQAYIDANVTGHLNLLEYARHKKNLVHFVYASSSSVYGRNSKVPFSVNDPVDKPASLYAATKRAGELMAETYAHLFAIPCTGLRFFTVYGPWGRPDMAAYLFCRKIVANEPIPVFNKGEMQRDFTYIEDVTNGVMAVLDKPHEAGHRLYNLGNSHPEKLGDFISIIEQSIGKKAVYDLLPMQPGDVHTTFADITESTRDFGYLPQVSLKDGLPRFVAWFKDYHRQL